MNKRDETALKRLRTKAIKLLCGECKSSLAPRRAIGWILEQELILAGIPQDDHWFWVNNIIHQVSTKDVTDVD